MYAFNARDGYEADDCPPIHGVFRSSRLRLFEDAIGTKPSFDLDQHSLLRFRHNVYSEVCATEPPNSNLLPHQP